MRKLKCSICGEKFTYYKDRHTLWCDDCYYDKVLKFDARVARNTVSGKIQRDGVTEV